jgi:DNA-binding beta-propeller fold protein YncE
LIKIESALILNGGLTGRTIALLWQKQFVMRLLIKFGIIFIVALAFHIAATAQGNFQVHLANAREAFKQSDYPRFHAQILLAHQLHPYHQGILYQAGVASALLKKPEDAIAFLKKAILVNANFDLKIPELASLHNLEEFKELLRLQQDQKISVVRSDTAFTLDDKALHIESITAGETEGVFYLGSIRKRKIVRFDSRKKTVSDFIPSADQGMTAVFGLKVDKKSKLLWACSSPVEVMQDYDSTLTSAVFCYDLKTGSLKRKYVPEKKGQHTFGDLAIDTDGKAYVSDSKGNKIFMTDDRTGKLTEFISSDLFWSLQGITFSGDGKYMFIADYIRGVFRLDMKTKALILLETQVPASLKSIDGLTFYKNSLIAIQNATVPMRVTVYELNDDKTRISQFKILDRAHPAFGEPTIGCVDSDTFYYVANSQWGGYTKTNELKPMSELQNVVILKSKLK